MTAPFGTICTTALHSSPFLGYVFFCIMYFCIKVKHYNLPSDPKIQEGDGLWGGGGMCRGMAKYQGRKA